MRRWAPVVAVVLGSPILIAASALQARADFAAPDGTSSLTSIALPTPAGGGHNIFANGGNTGDVQVTGDGLNLLAAVVITGAGFGPTSFANAKFSTTSNYSTAGVGGDFTTILSIGNINSFNVPPLLTATWAVEKVTYSHGSESRTYDFLAGGGSAFTVTANAGNKLFSDGAFKASSVNTSQTGGFVYGSVNAITVFWTMSTSANFNHNATMTMEIDAIANPEPGTLALFGLGAAGLGAAAWRRRARRAKPSA